MLLSAAGDDPERTFFVHPAKLGEALVVVPAGGAPRLGYLTPMERDEAAATGLELLSPEQLDVARWSRDTPEPGPFHANVLAQALQLSQVGPGRIALAGRLPFGLAHEVLSRLGAEGWTFVSASAGLLELRKSKSASEVAEIRRVAGVTCQAMRAVAALLAGAVARDGELWLESEPLRVARVKAEVARIFAGAGLEQPRGNIVAPGGEGGVPHSSGTPERASCVRAKRWSSTSFRAAACSPTVPAPSASASRRSASMAAHAAVLRRSAAGPRRRFARASRLGPPGSGLRGVHRPRLSNSALRARHPLRICSWTRTRSRVRVARASEFQTACERGRRPCCR